MGGRGGSSHSKASGASMPFAQFGSHDFSGFYYDPNLRTAEAKQFAEGNFSQAEWDNLKPNEREGIRKYTGSYYVDINDALFGKTSPSATIKKYIDDATDGLNKLRAKFDFVAVRGDTPENTMKLLGGSINQLSDSKFLQGAIGDVVEFKGFMSSAITESKAWTWKGVTAWVAVPKGTPGIYVDPVSVNQSEKEWLFNRSVRLRVEEIRTDMNGSLNEVFYTVVPAGTKRAGKGKVK